MAQGNKLKFIEGAVAGVALAVAAGMFLKTKRGKKLKKDIESVAADFYEYVSPMLKSAKKMSEKEYKIFMKNAAEQYAKVKKISSDMAKQLIEKAQESWKNFSDNLTE